MKKTLILFSIVVSLSIQQYGNCAEKSEVKHYDQVTDFTVPPWKIYPEIEYQSIGWRMGYGEYYILRWHKYFRALTPTVRKEYQELNPEIESWQGFYSASDELYTKLENRLNK